MRSRRSELALLGWGALLACNAAVSSCGSSSGKAAGQDAGGDSEGADAADSGSGSGGMSGSNGSSGASGGSGSSSGTPLPDASEPPCTLTVQGSVNGSFPCTTTTEYFTSANRTTFIVSVADPRPLQLVSVSLQHAGHAASGTWSSTDPGAVGTLTVQASSPDAGTFPTWQCSAGGGTSPDGGPDGGSSPGSYALDLMVGQGKPTPTGETFGSTGTLSAILPARPQSGATGSVMVHVSF